MLLRLGGESAVGLLKVLLAGSLGVPILLFAIFAWVTYWTAIDDERLELQRASQVAREHASKVMEAQEQVGERVDDLVRGMSDAETGPAEAKLHQAMLHIVSGLPDISSVMLIGKTGRPVASAKLYPVPGQLDFSDRDFFQALRNGYEGTFLSKPELGAVSQLPFWGVARRWSGPDNAFNGVIIIGVLPSVFHKFYATLAVSDENGRMLTLVRSDGQIILRYPPLNGEPPRVSPNSSLMQQIAAHPERGTFYDRSTVDADMPERLFAYERVPGYPLYVVAGKSRAATIAGWALTMGSHLIFGIPATLALFLITLTALRRTQQKEDALARSDAEMRRREAAEAALLQSQRLDAIGQMTGGIAHDFNNLLTVVMGNLEMLDKRPNDPVRVQRIAANALLAAKRGADVTQKLLAFSRRQLVHPETLNLNQRLLEFKPLLDQAGGTAVVELALDPKASMVRLDPGQLEAAMINLVVNARDAMGSGGRVVISTGAVQVDSVDRPDMRPGPYVRIAVSDTGPGMDPQTAARAFEPFFTTKRVGQGTGLGLSQVYGFAKQAGGDVRIVSAPREGTTVEILLPRSWDDGTPQRPEADLVPLRNAREGEVILVVEDEPAVLELAIESLHDLGYKTLSANNAQAALELLRGTDQIDALFSDMIMPGGMNGLQLSLEARRLRPRLKVLLTSGYAPTLFGQNLPEGVPLMTKPYSQSQLATQLRAVLGA